MCQFACGCVWVRVLVCLSVCALLFVRVCACAFVCVRVFVWVCARVCMQCAWICEVFFYVHVRVFVC